MVVDLGEVKSYIKPKTDSTLRNMRKDDLVKYIRRLEYIHNVAVQKWISVSERLPDADGIYIVRTVHGTLTTARFYAFKYFPATKHLPETHRSASWQAYRNVTHWMPLPEPPKESEIDADRCICCGGIIPEGRQVCTNCERGGGNRKT